MGAAGTLVLVVDDETAIESSGDRVALRGLRRRGRRDDGARLSLRARLLLAVVGLAALGLVTSGAVTYTALRSFLLDRVEEQLGVTAQSLLEEFRQGDGAPAGGALSAYPHGTVADLILVRAGDVNSGPLVDPVSTVVRSAQPANVDTVMVDGRTLKLGGSLVDLDAPQVVADAAASRAAVRRRAGDL